MPLCYWAACRSFTSRHRYVVCYARPPPGRTPPATEKVELSREAKREVELSIMELRDELEEEGLDEDAIDAKCDALRTKLLEKAAADAAA